MKQPIAGVAPSQLDEVTTMAVWPTITGPPFRTLGCLLGRLYSINIGIGPILTIGNLFALLSIPLVLFLFVHTLVPGLCHRYRLTNRRVIVERKRLSWTADWAEEAAVSLDKFDEIDIQVVPGQHWFPAGDLIFRDGKTERLQLLGVSRPETFRQTCLKSGQSHVGVKRALGV
ncbi:uncharacterized protein METZ01_LOCUS492241 [marine metagenome]|uniref:DUF304 domain-containing protein n=1 Tax=marine metagenome TaxID=408172 RepID=A0A383D4A7_9ZZZZ